MHSEGNRATKGKMIAVDFFCGAGGLTKGFRDAGINVRLGVDKDPIFKKTYEENNPPAVFWGMSVENVKGEAVWECLSPKDGDKVVVAACAPCQPFSAQNKRSVLKGYEDERKDLLSQMLRIVSEFERLPDYFFIENVPGFKKSNCPSYQHLKSFLKKNHYAIGENVVDAAIYGVPQRRKRFILIAQKLRSNQQALDLLFPNADYGPRKTDFITVKQAFKELPPIRAGGSSRKFSNHHAPKLSLKNLDRIKNISHDGGSHSELSKEKSVPCHLRSTGHGDTYGRMRWKTVSPTLTCKCVSLSNGRFGHPTQDRAISVREAARLQTFPDDYIFYGTGITSEAKQVGNAVPVKLAEAFGKHLIELDRKK
jgi:DNA (cytosine-5)-methyltransferase 1